MGGASEASTFRAGDNRGQAAAGGTVFRSLGVRLIAATGLTVAIGIGAMILFHTHEQEQEILAANEHTLRQLTDGARRGLETIMMGGHADVAPYFAERLKDIRDLDDFRVLRPDGTEAFLDNDTVSAINERFGTGMFPYKPIERTVRVLSADDPGLHKALAGTDPVAHYDTDAEGARHITLLSPIVLDERCMSCHEGAPRVKGVIKLTAPLAEVERSIRATWHSALVILAVAVTLIGIATLAVVRRSVIRPIRTVSEAMARVAGGELDQAVPVLGRDELAQMAASFNTMLDHLLRTYDGLQDEQNKLTTIILAAIEGIVVADDHGSIVLVNPAAEQLLGRDALALMGGDFLDLIGDRALMAGWLAAGTAQQDITLAGRILNIQVARITDGAGATVGSSALLRDITEERNLERRLLSLSSTDALTGLWNRRHLDQTLATEFERARRYGLDLSLLLFDVDHFKRFNDTYGHDQGDRVLKAVAAQIARSVREVDIACRYGGEEFVVILPETGIDGAAETAERLRAEVAGLSIDGLGVTITIGVAGLRPHGATSAAALIEQADRALYAGKEAGRNRVVRADAAAEA